MFVPVDKAEEITTTVKIRIQRREFTVFPAEGERKYATEQLSKQGAGRKGQR